MYSLALTIVYLTGGIYNVALYMAVILIPLYALTLGLGLMAIATLVSVPVVLQIVIRFVGGAMTDRWGEKNILLLSYGGIALTGAAFVVAQGYWSLMAAQFLLSFSRALFWSPAQSYLSLLPAAKPRLGQVMGYFNGTTSAGAVVGLVLGGVFPEVMGYHLSFLSVVSLGALCFSLCLFLPVLPRQRAAVRFRQSLAGLIEVMQVKPLYLAGICAFVAALPMALVSSFYPIYLDAIGFGESLIGVLTSLRSVGVILAGVLLGRYVDRLGEMVSFIFGLVLAGAGVLLTGFSAGLGPLALFIIMTGIGSGTAQILYQTMTARYSPEDKRGAAMSLTGNFWSASLLVTPLLFGLVTEHISLVSSFMVVGTAVAMVGLLGPALFKLFVLTVTPGGVFHARQNISK